MKEEKTENMVLRTVYLPKGLDSKLRDMAYKRGQSKGDLIRELIQNSLASEKVPVLRKKEDDSARKPQKKQEQGERKRPEVSETA